MRYKAASSECCSPGCTNARRQGQRTCKECHKAQQRDLRERQRDERLKALGIRD